jgi:hypothetical protein
MCKGETGTSLQIHKIRRKKKRNLNKKLLVRVRFTFILSDIDSTTKSNLRKSVLDYNDLGIKHISFIDNTMRMDITFKEWNPKYNLPKVVMHMKRYFSRVTPIKSIFTEGLNEEGKKICSRIKGQFNRINEKIFDKHHREISTVNQKAFNVSKDLIQEYETNKI